MAEGWKGFDSISAWKKGVTWGTAVQVGAGDQIGFLSENIARSRANRRSAELNGTPWRSRSTSGRKDFNGPWRVPFNFDEIHRPLAHAMGTAGTPTTVEATVAFKHVIKPKASLFGIFGSLVFANDAFWVREYPSAKLNGFTISNEADGDVAVEFPVIGSNEIVDDTGATQIADYSTITRPNGDGEVAVFEDVQVLLNAQAGGALSGSDEIFIEGVSIEFASNLEAMYTSENAPLISEPQRNGRPEFTVELSLATFEEVDRITAQLNDTLSKMSITWGNTVDIPGTASSNKYYSTLYFPRVEYEPASQGPIEGEGMLKETVRLHCIGVDTIPTGFPTGYTDALTIEIQNADSSDALS